MDPFYLAKVKKELAGKKRKSISNDVSEEFPFPQKSHRFNSISDYSDFKLPGLETGRSR